MPPGEWDMSLPDSVVEGLPPRRAEGGPGEMATQPPDAPGRERILTATSAGIMMPPMRTTLTLDPDVAHLVQNAVHEERRPMKQVVNDALRRALAPQPRRERVQLVAHRSAVRPGLDLGKLNQLADELEDDVILDAARRAR